MRILAIGGIRDRQIREGIDADVLEAEMLTFGGSAVVVDRERAFGQQTNGLGHRGLTQSTKRGMSKTVCR